MTDSGLDRTALTLDRNLALMAGAGAGKTHSLVTLCLHLLGGARGNGAAVRPSQLFMLTFTDKAAAEMRARLRQRLDAMARGDESRPEDLLRQSFERLQRPFPPRMIWRRLRDELGEATIGTFHSLCAQLLRRAPAGSGTDLGFKLLGEREALELIRDCADRTVLEFLESGDPVVMDLCREWNFLDRGRSGGLVTQLCALFSKIREEGLPPEAVPISDEASARAEFSAALGELERAVAYASAINAAERGEFASTLEECRRALDGMTLDTFFEPRRFFALRDAIEDTKGSRRRNGLADALKTVKQRALGNGNGQLGLRDYYAGWAVVAHEQAFRRLLMALRDRHRAELDKRAALDFSDLLIRTRDLLRHHPAIRREAQERIRALLVDEFQDTNRLQLEIVLLLAEKRDGSPRLLANGSSKRGSPELELPLESKLLCAVGDRKQSIYEFRGADVSVFELLAKKIEDEGGLRLYLRHNRRSSPALLSFFNRAFAQLMQGGSDQREYEISYISPGDDQIPIREQRALAAPVDWLVFEPKDNAEECRQQEADAVARRVRQLLSSEAAPLVEQRDGVLRRAQGGDIALLFRRFTYVEVYRQALVRYGVPHRVVRGRGFYGAQEVLDLASAVSLLSDPGNAIALAAVLRSPLVCISDPSLMKLSVACGNRLSLRRLQSLDGIALAALPSNERQRCERFLQLFPKLRRERDRLGIRTLLRVLLDEMQYRVAIAGTPFGEQALANIEKLLELAARWDEAAKGGCASFARELLGLADQDPSEAQADVLDSADRRAVQLLTIHQAKGLEWPIVFVPDLAASRYRSQAQILFDRQHGLALRIPLPDNLVVPRPPRFTRAAAELSRREDAEYLRLLYVALTRSRDHLVLSGQTTRQAKTWRAMLEGRLAADRALRALVREVKTWDLPVPSPEVFSAPQPTPASEARIDAAMKRVRRRAPARPSRAVFPVTHLQDYVLCPRRFLYAHRTGLSEYPTMLEIEEGGQPPPFGGRGASNKRQQGTLAHRLLERADLRLAFGTARAQQDHLDALLWEEGMDPAAPDGREIVGWVKAFFGTSFARRLAAAGPHRVHRELPFLLRLEGSGGVKIHLKGQIDLLFEDEEGGALVIDYKAISRHPAGLAPYAFQLDCYALAARHFVRQGVRVETGIAFLQQHPPEPEIRCSKSAGDLDTFEQRLVRAASELLQASEREHWTGLPQNECAAIRCGYQYRCHAAAAGL